jgi:hypothetical protein
MQVIFMTILQTLLHICSLSFSVIMTGKLKTLYTFQATSILFFQMLESGFTEEVEYW